MSLAAEDRAKAALATERERHGGSAGWGWRVKLEKRRCEDETARVAFTRDDAECCACRRVAGSQGDVDSQVARSASYEISAWRAGRKATSPCT